MNKRVEGKRKGRKGGALEGERERGGGREGRGEEGGRIKRYENTRDRSC